MNELEWHVPHIIVYFGGKAGLLLVTIHLGGKAVLLYVINLGGKAGLLLVTIYICGKAVLLYVTINLGGSPPCYY